MTFVKFTSVVVSRGRACDLAGASLAEPILQTFCAARRSAAGHHAHRDRAEGMQSSCRGTGLLVRLPSKVVSMDRFSKYDFEYHAIFVRHFIAFPIALTWHAGATHAPKLIVPRLIGVFFAYPAYTETLGTVSIHFEKTRGPRSKDRGHTAHSLSSLGSFDPQFLPNSRS
jgi:hypothetical protein